MRLPLSAEYPQRAAATALKLMAFAVTDEGQPWAVFPTTNALPATGAGQVVPTWASAYDWGGQGAPCAVTVPNANQPASRYVPLALTSLEDPLSAQGPTRDIHYYIELQNPDPRPLSSATLDLAATTGLTFQQIQGISCGGCTPGAANWSISLPSLAFQASRRITVTAQLGTQGAVATGAVATGAVATGAVATGAVANQDVVTTTASLTAPVGQPAALTAVAQRLLRHRVDSRPPDVQVTTSLVGAGLREVTGVANDGAGAGVASVEISLNGSSWQVVSGTLLWSGTILVPTGITNLNLYSRATDKYGNISAPGISSLQVDGIGPNATLSLPPALGGA